MGFMRGGGCGANLEGRVAAKEDIVMGLVAKLRAGHLANFGNGYDGEFFNRVADELERLAGIVTALEDGCYNCKHPKRVSELTCQKNALQQVVSERDEKIASLQTRLRQGAEYVGSGMDYDVIKSHFEAVDCVSPTTGAKSQIAVVGGRKPV